MSLQSDVELRWTCFPLTPALKHFGHIRGAGTVAGRFHDENPSRQLIKYKINPGGSYQVH